MGNNLFQFFRWLHYKTDEREFLCRVLWTNEVTFTCSEVLVIGLYTPWMQGHWRLPMLLGDLRFVVNVYPGILDCYSIAPYLVTNTFSGTEYADFLERTIVS